MSWLFFALVTPFFYSLTNYIEKFIIEKKIRDPYVMTLFGGIFFFSLGFIISIIHGFHNLTYLQIASLFISGIFLVIYLVPYYKALSIDEASRIVPLFQFIPVFTIFLSYMLIGEHLTTVQIIGFIVIVIGGFIIGAEKIEKGIFIPRKSFWYMVSSSLLYSLVEVIFKFVVRNTDFYTAIFYQSFGIGFGSILLILNKNTRINLFKYLRTSSKPIYFGIFLSQFLGFIGEFSGAFAVSLGSVSLVSAIGGLQPFFVLIFGMALSVWFPKVIKEDLGKINISVKIISVILIISGVYLINV